ncbi:MAG TPA: hypothetical protein EYQ82_03265 [Dehalococcoidia bacterium]|nr:hypothetical protein [Dehalococcoidia bacterium]HIK99038.1 hypothetical protein [Dehalococcoidia bacterium]
MDRCSALDSSMWQGSGSTARTSGLLNLSTGVSEHLRTAHFDAFRNLQALCKAESPDFLLIAGGVFDRVAQSIHAQLAFRDGVAMVDADVQVYVGLQGRQTYLSTRSIPGLSSGSKIRVRRLLRPTSGVKDLVLGETLASR